MSSDLTTGQVVEASTEQEAREFILQKRPDAVVVWTEQSSNRDAVFKKYFQSVTKTPQLHGSTIGERQNKQAIKDNIKLLKFFAERLAITDLSSPEARNINSIKTITQRLLNLTYQS
jgi:hypothetical protein